MIIPGFKESLECLVNNDFQSLYFYNNFLLKKFFEYAFSQTIYINKIKSGKTGLNNNIFSQITYHDHARTYIIACSYLINNNLNKNFLFKLFFSEYITYKTNVIEWRGRMQWFEFNRSILSHFIWNNKKKIFLWTWHQILEHISNFKIKYPKISDWRRKWYIQDLFEMKKYIINLCIISNKISFLEYLISNNIIITNDFFYNIIFKLGYNYIAPYIKKTSFSKSIEWKWLKYNDIDIRLLNIDKCFNICYKTKSYKNRFLQIFTTKSDNPINFIKFFLKLKREHFSFLTNNDLIKIINSYNNIFIKKHFSNTIITKLFMYNDLIKPRLLNKFKQIMSTHSILLTSKYCHNILIYCPEPSSIKSFNHFKNICHYFIKIPKNTIKNINSIFLNKLYIIFDNKIDHLIRKHKQINLNTNTNINNCIECAICLSDINNSNGCRLPCSHLFHKKCIKKDILWNNKHLYKCPICRNVHSSKMLSNYYI